MDMHQKNFAIRLDRIDRRHRDVSDGYITSVNHDGLIIAVRRRRKVRVPYAGLALVALGIIAIKALAVVQMGEEGYAARIEGLASGSQIERVGAWVMQADPLTQWVATQFKLIVD